MSPRVTTIVLGLVILTLGVCGLVYPERVLGLIGLTYANPAHMAAALGEVRATYGGIFAVMGVYTVFAAMDPALHRGRLLFVGLLWLGACAGRLFGIYVDGNPGLPGWGAALFELVIGGALVAVAQSASAPAVRERTVSAPTVSAGAPEHAPAASYEPPPVVPPV